MERTFSPQPPGESSFGYGDDGYTAWESHQHYLPNSPLNATFSPASNRTYSETPYSYSSGGLSPLLASTPQTVSPRIDRTFSPQGGSPRMDRTFSPQRGSPRMDRTFSPQRMNETYSPQGGSPRMERTFSPQGGSSRMDRTFSPQRMDGTFSPHGGSPRMDRTFSPQRSGTLEIATPSLQPQPRPAFGTVEMSPHTPIISRFSRYGYTNPKDPVWNIPPDDELILPTGMKRAVTLTSPGKPDPLHLNVQVEPRSISQSPSGNHIICDIAIGVKEADTEERNPFFTPPMTETVRRYDRKHGMFTPKSVFKKGERTRRNIFDIPPQNFVPSSPPLGTSIEWEQDYLNRTYKGAPSGAGLNTTFTQESTPGTGTMNRTFGMSPHGGGLNSTLTRTSSPGTQASNRTFGMSPHGGGLNTTFTRASTPGTQGLNRTFDMSPHGGGLNTTFTRASSPGTQTLNRTFDVVNPSQAYGYQAPSYQEPKNPAWTHPRRKKAYR